MSAHMSIRSSLTVRAKCPSVVFRLEGRDFEVTSSTHTRTHARTHARTRARTRARTHTHTHARTHARSLARSHARTHGLKAAFSSKFKESFKEAALKKYNMSGAKATATQDSESATAQVNDNIRIAYYFSVSTVLHYF